ncbi:hypothetical protein [Nocardia sp. NPDC049149]|uniref:hypothetical protein n=1 Tax=Nocardia sp. NPDC049149 TaxID=3364315 RepID=UPI00371DDE69
MNENSSVLVYDELTEMETRLPTLQIGPNRRLDVVERPIEPGHRTSDVHLWRFALDLDDRNQRCAPLSPFLLNNVTAQGISRDSGRGLRAGRALDGVGGEEQRKVVVEEKLAGFFDREGVVPLVGELVVLRRVPIEGAPADQGINRFEQLVRAQLVQLCHLERSCSGHDLAEYTAATVRGRRDPLTPCAVLRPSLLGRLEYACRAERYPFRRPRWHLRSI